MRRVSSYDADARLPKIGTRWAWEIDKAHARELIEVADVFYWDHIGKVALTAAYAIDAPRLRAEAAAATLREVEAVLSRWQREAEQIGHHALVDTYKTVRSAFAAHFNPEANE